MCCEDWRIGYSTVVTESTKTCSGADELFLAADQNRTGIILFGTDAGTVHATTMSAAAVGRGVHVGTSHEPRVMTVKTHGRIIMGPWRVISDMAGRVLSFAVMQGRYCKEDQVKES